MRKYWKIILVAACIGALSGLVQAVLEYIFGITINGLWDILVLSGCALVVLSIWRPSLDSPE